APISGGYGGVADNAGPAAEERAAEPAAERRAPIRNESVVVARGRRGGGGAGDDAWLVVHHALGAELVGPHETHGHVVAGAVAVEPVTAHSVGAGAGIGIHADRHPRTRGKGAGLLRLRSPLVEVLDGDGL